MRIDWVPFSASSLVAGATMLSVGALMLPSGEDSAETLKLAQEEGGRWLAVSGLYFVAAVALTIGLPAILILFDHRAARLGLTAVSVLAVGAVGVAGFAMILAFFRALVTAGAGLDAVALEQATRDPGFLVFLYAWLAAFYLGELLLGIALLRAGTTRVWIPVLLIVHVGLLPISFQLPADVRALSALLVAVALSGVGITANARHSRVD